jgi:hypothetical protein
MITKTSIPGKGSKVFVIMNRRPGGAGDRFRRTLGGNLLGLFFLE